MLRYLKFIITSLLLSLFSYPFAFAQGETVIVSPDSNTNATTTETVVVSPAPAPATTTTTTTSHETMIVTPAPEAKETIVTPSGYANCFYIESGWYQDVWIPRHRICQYANTPGKVAWIEGYWACTKYDLDKGVCTNWDWKTGHWANTLVVY